MDIIAIILIISAFYGMGLFSGVWLIYRTYLKPGLARGILEIGKETYRVSKFVPRNTRV
jgi:hypothetical protein